MPYTRNGDEYFASQTFSEPLAKFEHAKIAVEASYYLKGFLDIPPTKEPLLAAIGGLPLAMKAHIEADLDQWKAHNLTPMFVFDGQSVVGTEDVSMRGALQALSNIDEAWRLYSQNQADTAVKVFGNSGAVTPSTLYRYFQRILFDRGLQFEVAPHSACAQIAYYDRLDKGDLDGIMGSLELLLYNIDSSVVTKIDFEKQVAHGVVKPDLIKKLNVSEDTFIDSFLLTGTYFLPACPALMDIALVPKQPYSIKDSINMYKAAGKSISSICDSLSDSVPKHEPDWEDKYRKAKMAIKHSIYLTTEGTMFINQYDSLTGDSPEYIALRLPDEIYHYLVTALVGPRVLNWLSSLEMLVPPPLDGGESEEYRHLVSQQLVPIQEETIALYSSRMHRAFQHKNVTIRFWYDSKLKVVMNHQGVQPPPTTRIASWNVSQDIYKGQQEDIVAAPGSIAFAILSLQDEKFANSTRIKQWSFGNVKTTEEVLTNTLWRFLQLRGYINDDHKLTTWGMALLTSIKALNPDHKLEEAAFLAFELLRYDLLNARHRHESWIGGPEFGTEDQNSYCLLIARCACLLKLRHESIGYTGPLSKNLLAYHSIISAVRTSDRDLIEGVIASMFLHGHATRQRDDFTQLGLSLPFIEDIDIGLGIAVKTYLDEQHAPISAPAYCVAEKQKYATYPILHSVDEIGDLDIAFGFFDAIHAGVKDLNNEVPDQTLWSEASKYLNDRRYPSPVHYWS